ncbi:hypothetical protein FB451DRAFT_1426193 [Mycena latifolia]|nr:hypothetical protein FB451DRAFT_1426193 [Mycena latifolia]
MPFSNLSLDLILEIVGWCGPRDLQDLRLVSRLFRHLLAKNQYLWRLSRAALHLGFSLPTAVNSEESLARVIFSGGPCTVCRRTTTELPYSFSLDIRICSASCSLYLFRVAPYDIDEFIAAAPHALFTGKPDSLYGIKKLMIQAMPYLEWTANR